MKKELVLEKDSSVGPNRESRPEELQDCVARITLQHMEQLVAAYDAYWGMDDVMELFPPEFSDSLMLGDLEKIAYLGDVLDQISPFRDPNLDWDDEGNKYRELIESHDIGLHDKAKILMGFADSLPLTLHDMTNLVHAYEGFSDLEYRVLKTTNVPVGNAIMENLLKVEFLVMDLSPIYDETLDWEDPANEFALIVEDPEMDAEEKARRLMGEEI